MALWSLVVHVMAVSPAIVHPASSWHLGGIRLPDCFGDLLGSSEGSQWWYMAGHVKTATSDELLSIFVLILRSRGSLGGIIETVTQLGIGDPRSGVYHHSSGLGVSAIDGPTWSNFSVQATTVGIPLGKYGLTYLGGGSGLGMREGTYLLEASTRATTETGNSTQSSKTDVDLQLRLTDQRGAMLEGYGGAILNTWEFAQPELSVSQGMLRIGDEELQIAGGSIWNDMQTKFTTPGEADPGLPDVYQWVVLSFTSGVAVQLSSWYDVYPQEQWISGDQVGRTARTGTGTLWRKQTEFGWAYENGGFPLVPHHTCNHTSGEPNSTSFCPYPPEVDWDFSVNILNTSHPSSSPHWTSPTTHATYATALTASFGERVYKELGYRQIFFYSVAENTEMTGKAEGVAKSLEHVGAVRVFDRPREDPAAVLIGMGVLEQYGYS
uniref:Uncharacterized protein n=1 Tax=Coccolithus braarudii TaxID=221442 RepID=A0A7S0Q589_9EUKA|mmetsp:Transcript_35956/g.76773  ORF Transcript_35956/g.76773 Transcript_35956/m.76773 type:complete len:437 (+) Transcript_35956:87-1397(+)